MRRQASLVGMLGALLLIGLLGPTACSDDVEGQVRAAVTILANQEGQVATRAAEQLQRHGRRALPTIEAAMHTAGEPGRKNLILALRRIGDGEAIPLLRHVAIFDASPEVRREAEWTLKEWAASVDKGAGAAERARAAQKALRAVDEQRGREEAG